MNPETENMTLMDQTRPVPLGGGGGAGPLGHLTVTRRALGTHRVRGGLKAV